MKIGDHISAVDDDLKGVVTSIKGSVVFFKDRYGFTHQMEAGKLVLHHAALYDSSPVVLKSETSKPQSKKHNKKHLVLDLHLDNLVKNPSDYDAFERLFIQKEKLTETLDFCRTHRLKKLEIIHGIGDGVLQKMVYDYLKSQTNLEFEDHEFFYHQTGSVVVSLK